MAGRRPGTGRACAVVGVGYAYEVRGITFSIVGGYSMKIVLTFTEPLLGTAPMDKEIYSTYIAENRVTNGGGEFPHDEVDTIGEDKGKTGFHRDAAGNPILYDYVIKGFFKDTCGMLARVDGTGSKKLRAYKKIIDGLVFVFPRQIPITVCGEIGALERPLRAQTAQGERVALACSEMICQPTAWDDAMHMRVVRQCRTPGVQHKRGANACTQMLAVSRDGLQDLGCYIEQQPIEFDLVLVRQIGNGRGQREDHVVILDGQQIGLAGVKPALGCSALALGAVAIAAGVVGDLLGGAAITTQHMSPQCRCAALVDGRHDLELGQAQAAALAVTPGCTMLVEDVGDLQIGPLHARTFKRAAWAPAGRSPRAAGQSLRGRRLMWSPASCAPAAPGSRGYRPCAQADAWQSCGAGCG